MADFTGGEWVKDGMTIRAKNGAGTIATIPSPKTAAFSNVKQTPT